MKPSMTSKVKALTDALADHTAESKKKLPAAEKARHKLAVKNIEVKLKKLAEAKEAAKPIPTQLEVLQHEVGELKSEVAELKLLMPKK